MNESHRASNASPRRPAWWLRAGATGLLVFLVIHFYPSVRTALQDFAAARAINSRAAEAFPSLAEPGNVEGLVFGNGSPVELVVFASYSCDLCRPFWRYLTDAERTQSLPATRLHFLYDPRAVELDSTSIHALLCAASAGNFRVVHRWLVDRHGWTRPGQLSRAPGLPAEGCEPAGAERLIGTDRELAHRLGLAAPPVILTRSRVYEGMEAVEYVRQLEPKR